MAAIAALAAVSVCVADAAHSVSEAGANRHAENMTNTIYRIAEIEVKSEYLDAYLSAAATVGATSVRDEPGVLCIFPMQDAENPTSIRILEIYCDGAAYKAHLASPHFRAYKEGTPHMIKSLRLVPMQPLDPDGADNIFKKWIWRKACE